MKTIWMSEGKSGTVEIEQTAKYDFMVKAQNKNEDCSFLLSEEQAQILGNYLQIPTNAGVEFADGEDVLKVRQKRLDSGWYVYEFFFAVTGFTCHEWLRNPFAVSVPVGKAESLLQELRKLV